MGAPVIWTAAWMGSRVITPRLIASAGGAAGRTFGAETGAHIAGILNHFIVRNFIGAEVQHALRHIMRGAEALGEGRTAEAEKEIECAIRVANDEDVKKDLKEANEYVSGEASRESIEESAKHLAEALRSRVPVRRGYLKSSVGHMRDPKTGEMLVGYGIRHRTRTAHLVEYGTKPHVIVPQKHRRGMDPAKALQFGNAYRARVQHPGQRGQHHLRDVMAGHAVTTVDTYKVKLNQKITEKYGS